MSAAALRSFARTAFGNNSDGELLAAVAAGDTVAFAEVVRRFGPLTLAACRRVLGTTADADDAFQLTFLALFRQAKSVRSEAALPGWLHRTAVRTAGKLKARAKKPTDAPEPAVSPDPAGELSWKEARAALDDELNGLPESLRGPLVLCYLDGRPRDEAAATLGVSLSTLKRRLAEGLEKLNRRLNRRGIVGVGLATAVLCGGLTAAVPANLANRVLLAVAAIPLGGGLPSLFTSWKTMLAAVVLVGGLATGAMLFAHPGDPVKAPPPKDEKADVPKPGTDQLTDPLPDGALARLGTSRLRGRRLTYSPDSKRVVRETVAGDLQLYEVPSGKFLTKLRAKDVPEREKIIGSTIAFSPDSKLLAAVLWEGRAGVWDTDTGKLVRWIDSGLFYSIVRCDFSPDGKLLAIGGSADNNKLDSQTVGVYETATGKQLFTAKGANSAFSDDGKQVLLWNGYGDPMKELRIVPVASPDDAVVCKLDTHVPNWQDPRTDGKELLFELTPTGSVLIRDWKTGETKHTLAGAARDKERGGVNLRYAPGRRELIVTQANPPALWCWNLDTGEQAWQREVPSAPYWAELSADGKVIVTPGKDGDVLTIDAKTGKDKAVIAAKSVGHSNSMPHISPDGKVVATQTASPEPGGGMVLFWDAATGKRLTDLPGHTAMIRDTVFTPDGAKILTTGNDNTLRTWDATTGRELSNVPLAAPTWTSLSPDGKKLYAADTKGAIRVVDPTTGKVETTFTAFKKELVGVTLTADGKRFVAAGRDTAETPGVVRLLNAATGDQIREFDTGTARIEQMAASADGSVIVTSHEGRQVTVWSADSTERAAHTGTGKREPAWKEKPPFYLIGSVAVSADGKRVVFSDQEAGVGVIDASDGTLLGRTVLKDVYYQERSARNDVRDVLAVSPDGKTVAWSGIESTADVYLIELRTRTVRRKFSGDSYPVKRLAFSPDGSKLLSTGPDGAALVWDVFDRSPRPFAEPDDKAISAWWGELAASEATEAEKAMRLMTCVPAVAVKFLTAKLTEPPVEPEVIDKLIAELGDPDFKTREAATRKLGGISSAVDKLEKAAEKSESAEVRERAEKLVAGLRILGPLRAERAVEVLERIGNADAKKLLETLAGGKDDTSLSADTKAALGRLKGSGR